MKKLVFSCFLSVLFLSTTYAQYGTERSGYDGDYFSLEGALDLFKQSSSLWDFERKLNTEENWVNNLDLNYDGRIDYIRVEHKRQGNYHAIVLQALVDRYDVQDVAVIEIEIIRRGEAILQIVGDEDIYGEEVVVEPAEGYASNSRGYHSDYGNYVNVYYWRPVQYILDQQYSVYTSPYRWQYYPTWWSPWAQCSWNVYRPRIVVYHRYYNVAHRNRVIRVHNFYRPYRSYNYDVVQRSNKVRGTHGRPPVYRSERGENHDWNANDHRNRGQDVGRSRTDSPSSSPRQNPSDSRDRTWPNPNQNDPKRRTPQIEQRSPNSSNNPDMRRSTTPPSSPRQSPSDSRDRTWPNANQNDPKRRTPQVEQRSPNSSNNPGMRQTTTPSRQPSARSSQPAPVSKSPATRSTSSKSSSPVKKRGNL